MTTPRIVFFGTPTIAVSVLEELEKVGILPSRIITAPDAKAGRGLELTPPPVKVWAQQHAIPVQQPEKLDISLLGDLKKESWDLFIVAAYGRIIPQPFLDIPTHGTLNVHPSLLPNYRGSSPIISQILNDEKHVGVSIMLLDAFMDHGPIVAQKEVHITPWPPKGSELEYILAHEGGALLASIIPDWLQGNIQPQEQDHSRATFTKKLTKEDGLIDLEDDPYTNYLKIQAFDVWPRTYFFREKGNAKIRVIITEALFENGELIIKKVIPEGKKEMEYEQFLKSFT